MSGSRERFGYRLSLSLTLSRAVLAAALVLIAMMRGSGPIAAAILVLGFLSDVYDGVVARHYGVATAGLRRLDSATDTVFYVAAALCVWRLHPEAIRDNRWLLAVVVGTLVINHSIELLKFGREAAYHAWTAKAWGIALALALVILFATGNSALVPLALVIGILSHLENLGITLVLPHWQHDVRSLGYALQLRRSAART